MRRKVKDEDDARRCLAGVKAVGGDAVGWAREHGVDARSLNAWRMNLARRRPSAAPRFVELVAAPSSRSAARYAVVVGDVRVEFDDHVEVATLLRVLQVVRAC